MKRGLYLSAVLVLVLLSACGRQAANNGATKSASPSASATSTATATQSATTAATPAPEGLTCKLPVVTQNDAGWVTFPGGSYQPDPKANVSLPHGPSGFPLSKSYDKAVERWVPVTRDQISPDGKHYAYADLPAVDASPIHIVDLPSGATHAFTGLVGLWLLDPSNGAVKQIDATHGWQYISGGGAWGTSDALTGHGPGPGSRLLRMDLKTGAIVSWYKRIDIEFSVAGADGSGHPILTVWKYQTPQLLLITAANSATILLTAPGSAVPSLSNYIHPVTDAHGIWLGDAAGSISLYTPATGIKKMAQVASGDVAPAGGCH